MDKSNIMGLRNMNVKGFTLPAFKVGFMESL